MKVIYIHSLSTNSNIVSLDFFQDGVTKFDEHFFNTQKNCQHLELQIIPQLSKNATSHPSNKRTRLD
jgi:hypothetical protein